MGSLSGTHAGALMIRIPKVCVRSGWTLAEMVRCLLIKDCLLIMGRKRGISREWEL